MAKVSLPVIGTSLFWLVHMLLFLCHGRSDKVTTLLANMVTHINMSPCVPRLFVCLVVETKLYSRPYMRASTEDDRLTLVSFGMLGRPAGRSG
jgi:hypothetical protein